MDGFRGLLWASILAVNISSAYAGSVEVIFYDNRIGTLNDVTGAYSQTGTLPVNVSSGIASMNGILYLEDSGMNLYSVDPASAASHLIGTTGISDQSAVFAGGAGGLFEVDYASNLYSLSSTNGKASLVGRTGLAANNGGYDTSMSMYGNLLYFTMGLSGGKDELYRISTTTGAATDLGSTGVTAIAGSAMVNGKLELYQYGQASNYVYSAVAGSLNFTQGALLTAQIIDGGTVLNSVNSSSVQGLTTPEPNSALLAGSGVFLLLVGVLVRARRVDSTYR